MLAGHYGQLMSESWHFSLDQGNAQQD